MRLIDAENAEKKFTQIATNVNPHYKECILAMALYLRNEDDLPTVDAEPVRYGHWFKTYDDEGEAWMCSECCEEWGFDEGHPKDVYGCNYCPNCGAKMDEEVPE